MFTLMIVDDFKIERENVKDIIAHSGLPIAISGEYANGREALAALAEQEPDFIITDIEMPFMDGLVFGEQVRQLYPRIKVILFSFHSKFEYAKKAIDLEAYAYILKPLVDEELVEALQLLIAEREQELAREQEEGELRRMLDQSRPLLAENFKRSLFIGKVGNDGELEAQLAFLKLELPAGPMAVLSIETDHYRQLLAEQGREAVELHALRISRVLNGMEAGAGSTGVYLSARIDDAHWAVLAAQSQPTAAQTQAQVQELAYECALELRERLEAEGISVSIGISAVSGKLAELPRLYAQAVSTGQHKFRLGRGQIIRCEDIADREASYAPPYAELQDEIADILHQRDRQEAARLAERLFGDMQPYALEHQAKDACLAIILHIRLALASMGLKQEAGWSSPEPLWERLNEVETLEEMKGWIGEVFAVAFDSLEYNHSHQYGRIIDEAIKFIKANYQHKITVKSVADALLYSSNYLNHLFKQHTGETILEFITKVRVEEAKRIMAEEPSIKMYALAEAVGYSQESYFRNVFKQHTGLTPREYKDGHK